ncbi:hypothetical protein T260_15205 [Geobacillus thermopakistaniensis]|uniref:Uncharacterized protein n=1 Tax=Geobacillus thermopakistaniensis (strain MAS1) TaxID=1408282 RepID=A0A7U9J953_GEOTM|nr:hypothetical protein T260_15205 [Geobacillus sp. MAS1]GAJ60171.1 hypothetical protein B23_3397 [Geobacillus thermoleovorans B23]
MFDPLVGWKGDFFFFGSGEERFPSPLDTLLLL